MIIEKESILNNLPRNILTDKEIIFMETIRHLIRMIDISYNRLIYLLSKDTIKTEIELLMIDVWNIIDSSHRLRCILDKTPGIKKNQTWFQLTVRKLSGSEDIRNFIQHYNREIEFLIIDVKPLMGHLSWSTLIDDINGEINFIVPGPTRPFELELVNPIGKPQRHKIDLVTFYIGKHQISISDLFYQLNELKLGLERHLEQK